MIVEVNPLTPELLALGLVRYIVFLFSTTCHEASHALVAKLGGDPTAFHSGQVSLNPVPHIRREPFGMVVVPLLALLTGGAMIGWASAPYDPAWQQRHPRRAAWMSLAGPAANFSLVLIAAILIHAGILAGLFRPPEQLNSLHLVPPLDGFSAVGLVLPDNAAAGWNRLGRSLRGYSFLALLLCWQLFERIYWPVFSAGVGLLYPGMYR